MDKKKPDALPNGIKASDLRYPKRRPTGAQLKNLEGVEVDGWHSFQLWLVNGEWMVPTLAINTSRRGGCRRSYCIGVADRKVYAAGNGPHVTAQITVYLSMDNFTRILPFLILKAEGLKAAHEIRDRVSSRRAQGQIHRAAGRTSWRW